MKNPYNRHHKAYNLFEFLKSNKVITYNDFMNMGYNHISSIIYSINVGKYFRLLLITKDKYSIKICYKKTGSRI